MLPGPKITTRFEKFEFLTDKLVKLREIFSRDGSDFSYAIESWRYI